MTLQSSIRMSELPQVLYEEISVHAPMIGSCMPACDGADITIYQYRPTLEWQSLVEYSHELHWQSLVEYSHEV